ncbi:MAG: radical SAM protein [Firmicutes bacterium]|nr:radical SAM protein [Bacillota bacterium]
MSILPIQQPEELGFEAVIAKYPEVPALITLKIDVQRRGVHYTPAALSAVNESIHQVRSAALFGYRDAQFTLAPESLLLRDGTSIITSPTPLEQNPYTVDLVDDKLVLVDKGSVIEEVEYWRKPDYYALTTSSGIPMNFVVSARPQRLSLTVNGYCNFWDNDKGCRYCDIVPHLKQQKAELGIRARLNPRDVSETFHHALKEAGRFCGICLTAGSNTRGEDVFDEEVDYYIEILQAIGENFSAKKFPSQLIASAFTERQLSRLYEETGIMGYTSDLEVLNERLFNWICPGKTEWVGYQEWKKRLIKAVDIFGPGHVNTGIVGGVELAKPYGFTSEDEALRTTLEEAESLASYGVTTVYIVWVPRPHSYFRDQKNASLEYYVRLARGLHEIRVKYGLTIDSDDYRRCGNHPDSDLSRLS